MIIRDKTQKEESSLKSKNNISVASEKNQRSRETLAYLLGNSFGWVRESKIFTWAGRPKVQKTRLLENTSPLRSKKDEQN